MSYTLVSTSPAPANLVALYAYQDGSGPAEWWARQVLGYGLFRNPDNRGSGNYLVPLHGDDFLHDQEHEYTYKELRDRLPKFILIDQDIFEAATYHQGAYVELSAVDGWVVSK